MNSILVIEDSKVINATIAKRLTSLGFDVSQAFTLAEAEKFLDEKRYDLVILDLHLPDGDGVDLIDYINNFNDTKIVVLTSVVDIQLREELFRYGILDYIIKDKNLLYSIEQIIKVIKKTKEHTNEKILVIDDSRVVCKQVEKILTPRNYIVDKALNAKDGFEKLKKEKYSLIILDLYLPDMDGMEVLEKLRNDKKYNMTPILVLSGSFSPNTVRDVLKSGANDFIQKPFVFEEFVLKVDIWVDYYIKERKLEELSRKLEDMNLNLEKMVEEEIAKNRKKDELMIVQSRFAQMGEAINMIAHQWRQPLNAISILSTSLYIKAQFGNVEKEEVLDTSEKIRALVKEMTVTIDNFRNFFKPQKEKTKTSFEKIFKKAYEIMEPVFKDENVEVEIEKKGDREFESYENELVQVVINIMKNALDAMQEKGVKNPKIKVEITDEYISIADNGGGIPEEIMDKIFEPYFSTKSKNGTGIGLYMSKVIVEEHCGGKLEVENVNRGARFTIRV